MESSHSPRTVLVLAWRLGTRCLPRYASKFSRHDFTLPQLFACLVLRQFYNLSYRRTAALLADVPEWCAAIELSRVPDHRTLCDAFDTLTTIASIDAMLDHLAECFEQAGVLQLDRRPLAIDSSCYESHHVSWHFEHRRNKGKAKNKRQSERSRTVKGLPKLAIAVATASHVVLAAWSTTGAGADDPHFEPVLFDAWRRAPVRSVAADAGYDSEDAHCLARDDLGVRSIIPPLRGRPSDKPPPTYYRRMMKMGFADGSMKAEYGQRWQSETVNSMMKRLYGSALRARDGKRRERELLLKAVVHDLAL